MNPSETDLRKELEDRLRFETLPADLSTRFSALPADQVDGAIEDAQRRIVETLGLDRSSLWQFSEENTVLLLTHSWQHPGLQSIPSQLDVAKYIPWGYERFLRGETIRFASVDELPPEAAQDVETFRPVGTKSNVSFPLVAGGAETVRVVMSLVRSPDDV